MPAGFSGALESFFLDILGVHMNHAVVAEYILDSEIPNAQVYTWKLKL